MDTLVRRVEGPQANSPAMPPPPGVTSDFVHRPSRAHEVIVVWSVSLSIAVIFVAIRMYTRLFIIHAVGYDDYTSVVALVFAVAVTALAMQTVKYGSGRHLWDVPLRDFSPYYLYYGNLAIVLYPVLMIFAKSSILLLYHRIFKPSRITVWAIYATLALVISYNISIMFASIFACTPREKYWNITIPGTCIELLSLGVAGSALNLATDLIILCLPMPMVWKLRLPLKQKLAVIGIFATGALVCAIAMIRLKAVIGGQFDPDLTWGQVPNSITGAIESNIGIACGCMPCLKPFFTRYVPKIMSITSLASRGKSSKHSHGGSSSSGGVQEISSRFSSSKRDKMLLGTNNSSDGDIDPRFSSGKYLELGEMGTHETVIGGPSSRSLNNQGIREPIVTPAPPKAAMVADGRGIVKTVGVDVFADEKRR